ncbi:MAG: polysaccharide pyruvyl transferase family protein [Clostridia bacterium]|nr:polysaccharide pyruvyl transferase family protein [Clostridia bacterium]
MSKVAVINRTNFKNYGSVLQCYALCRAVKQLGYDSEIVWVTGNLSKNFDFRPRKIISSLWKLITHPSLLSATLTNAKDLGSRVISEETVRLFDEFVGREIVQRSFSQRELSRRAVSDEYKKFVCGSDQIWCSTTLYPDPLMYLRFAPRDKRVAYAPSIGRDFIPSYNRRKMKKYISEIPHLSVREFEGERLIKELCQRDAKVVLDPTLLLESGDYDGLKSERMAEGKYLLCYFLDTPSAEVQEKISALANERGAYILALGARLVRCEELSARVEYPDAGPREFLSFVSGADVTVTDSYHGMLFSIIYEREFFSVERAYKQYDQSSRQTTVLRMLSLENRYIKAGEDFPRDAGDIDYEAVKREISRRREESLSFLGEALEK